MTDPRDQIDDWLRTEVAPLSPPPGALNRIRRRARKRKTRQVLVASAGCAVVLAAGVTVPQVLSARGSSANLPVATSQAPVITQPTGGASANGPAPQGSGSPQIQRQQRTRLSTSTSGTLPPGHFRPTSVTFVGDGQGGVVGAVIGQAGPPCANAGDCTSLAGTSDYGASWYGVSAPVAPGPDKATGVSQLRFANLRDGWAFGPALYETTGGGWPWRAVQTNGQRVISLEASGQNALAVFATCSGSLPDYAGGCTSFTLYGGAAGQTAWTPVIVPPGYQQMTTALPGSVSLVISRGTGYLLTPSGMVLSGPVTGGAWKAAGQAPCTPAPGGTQSGALLATTPGQLLLTCATGAAGAQQVVLYASADGIAWHQVGAVPGPGSVTALASAASDQVVVATTAGISYSADAGVTWHSASIGGAAPAGGFSYVGMTSATLGVAVPADPAAGAVYVSRDGGQTWSKSPISG